MAFSYEEVNPRRDEARLLSIGSDMLASTTGFTLQKYDMRSNPPRYVAVSYTANHEEKDTNIIVNDQVMQVTASLEGILRKVYSHVGFETLLWVDTICVDQMNDDERGQNILLVEQIFRQADAVYADVEIAHSTDTGHGSQSRAISSVSNDVDDRIKASDLTIDFDKLSAIIGSPLWRQIWAVHHSTVASKIYLLWGKAALSWDDLLNAYTKCANSSSWWPDHEVSVAPFNLISELRRKCQRGDRLDICELIVRTRGYATDDPRDSVHALLALEDENSCWAGEHVALTGRDIMDSRDSPYSKSVSQVRAELTRIVIQKNATLYIILPGREDKNRAPSLPTWSPNWCSADVPEAVGEAVKVPRIRRSLPGVHGSSNHEAGTLEVAGVTVGVMATLTSTFQDRTSQAIATGNGLRNASDVPSQTYYSGTMGVASALTASILGSGLTHKDHPSLIAHYPSLGSIVCLRNAISTAYQPSSANDSEPYAEYARWLSANDNIRINGRRIRESFTLGWQHIIVIALLSIATLFTWPIFEIFQYLRARDHLKHTMRMPRRLMVLENGSIGHACDNAKIGDHVCLLAGSTKAVVLRKRINEEQNANDNAVRYTVVGGAAVCFNRTQRRNYRRLIYWRPDRARYRPHFHFDLVSYEWQKRNVTVHNIKKSYYHDDWWESFVLV